MSRRSIPGLPVAFLIIVLGLCFGLSLGSAFLHTGMSSLVIAGGLLGSACLVWVLPAAA